MRQMVEQNNTNDMPMLKSLLPEGHRFGRYAPLEDRPSFWVPTEFNQLRKKLRTASEKFEEIQNTLFERADPTSAKFYTWIEPYIPLKIYFGPEKAIAASEKPVFTASSEFWRHMGNVLDRKDLEEYVSLIMRIRSFYWY
jgi:hypothetical protein